MTPSIDNPARQKVLTQSDIPRFLVGTRTLSESRAVVPDNSMVQVMEQDETSLMEHLPMDSTKSRQQQVVVGNTREEMVISVGTVDEGGSQEIRNIDGMTAPSVDRIVDDELKLLEDDIGWRGYDSEAVRVVDEITRDPVIGDRVVVEGGERMVKDDEGVKMNIVNGNSGGGGDVECIMKRGYCTIHKIKGKKTEVSNNAS